MNNWHLQSLNQKKALVKSAWLEMGIINMYIEIYPLEKSDEPINSDGSVKVYLSTSNGPKEALEISYRSIYDGHEKYIRHALKTMAHELAKKYFNIPRD